METSLSPMQFRGPAENGMNVYEGREAIASSLKLFGLN